MADNAANLGEGLRIGEVSFTPIQSSPYIAPYRMKFIQNDKKRVWDCVKAHDSLSILLFNTSTKELVIVKQFRPAVYARKLFDKLEKEGTMDLSKLSELTEIKQDSLCNSREGITYEVCAGLVDKNKPLEEIAQSEAWEECGYRVPLENIKKFNSYLSSLGLSATKHTMFYAEVTNEMRVGTGGGLTTEQEEIEVLHLSLGAARHLLWDETRFKSCGLCLAITWFLTTQDMKLYD
ncbi:Uridine diphosphate glucose pyrophosphatase-like isoform X1 [Oopsacas minuta]|uniref:Uridine diphosphate glucose pyrophosphatase NUDT14 n=1 Tax=Oopsacas minuta TaxID=111878 RepID=A0AAV7KEA4_9METZ|nr:Uridine diphosphate glucose pyrophosphatase-like isoform X1 [Oopsacas minuta]